MDKLKPVAFENLDESDLISVLEIARRALQNSAWSQELGWAMDLSEKELDNLYRKICEALKDRDN